MVRKSWANLWVSTPHHTPDLLGARRRQENIMGSGLIRLCALTAYVEHMGRMKLSGCFRWVGCSEYLPDGSPTLTWCKGKIQRRKGRGHRLFHPLTSSQENAVPWAGSAATPQLRRSPKRRSREPLLRLSQLFLENSQVRQGFR